MSVLIEGGSCPSIVVRLHYRHPVLAEGTVMAVSLVCWERLKRATHSCIARKALAPIILDYGGIYREKMNQAPHIAHALN